MDSELRARIEKAAIRHPLATNGKIAHNCNCKVADVDEIRNDLGLKPPPSRPVGVRKPSLKGKGMSEFRAKHDVDLIIRTKVLGLLSEGNEEYFEDYDFREICGVSVHHWRRHADSPEFSEYRLKKGSLNVWAPAHIIMQMKKILGVG